jgi:hypothetical protein
MDDTGVDGLVDEHLLLDEIAWTLQVIQGDMQVIHCHLQGTY